MQSMPFSDNADFSKVTDERILLRTFWLFYLSTFVLLLLQERMFKSLLQSLLENVNSRLDAVIGTVAELKAGLNICQVDARDLKKSLEFSQIDIDEVKPYATKLAKVEADIRHL